MRKNPISVYSGGYPTSTSLADFEHIQYPFHTLPAVTSHIYPHYIMYDVGKKLEHFFGKNLSYPLPHSWEKGLIFRNQMRMKMGKVGTVTRGGGDLVMAEGPCL